MEFVSKKNPAAVELGRKGGKARLRTMTPEQRSEHGKKMAEARWSRSEKGTQEKAGAVNVFHGVPFSLASC